MTKRITDFSTVIEFFFCNEMEEKKKNLLLSAWKSEKYKKNQQVLIEESLLS